MMKLDFAKLFPLHTFHAVAEALREIEDDSIQDLLWLNGWKTVNIVTGH